MTATFPSSFPITVLPSYYVAGDPLPHRNRSGP
jgi:hypothetical protein